jgi:hypothetical protein
MAIPRGCDQCGRCDRISAVYEQWPTCCYCVEPICPACVAPGTTTEADLDEPAACLCVDCDADEREAVG